MQREKVIIGNTSKIGIKTLNEYYKDKNISIIINRDNKICGIRKNDYPNKEEKPKVELNIRDILTFGDEK